MAMDAEVTPDAVPLRAGFDHSCDPGLLAGHFAEWSTLRSETPAFRSDRAAEFGYDLWYLLRYDDIHAALHDTELFSSSTVQYLGNSSQRMVPEELDPPEHTKFRQLLSRPLSPGNVLKLEDEVRARCTSLIDEIASRGKCDYVHDFALRFPTRMFCSIMGLPVEHTDELVALAQTVLHLPSEEDPTMETRGGAVLEIVGHLAEGFDARRQHPEDDLMSQLVAARIDEEPMSDEDRFAMGFLLFLAGLDTVANVLAYSTRHLAEDPSLRVALTEDPSRWPIAIEELLRLYSIASTSRVVTRDTVFAGCPMKAGDRVVLPTAAAGRDPDQFDRADDLVVGRAPNRHLAFGAGPHRCVGAHLARLELRVAMEEWHRRIPIYELAPGAMITEHVGAVAGMDSLPLVWPT